MLLSSSNIVRRSSTLISIQHISRYLVLESLKVILKVQVRDFHMNKRPVSFYPKDYPSGPFSGSGRILWVARLCLKKLDRARPEA
ncbi:hypothetical protein ABKN59_004380 [Abortiporus biennis]